MGYCYHEHGTASLHSVDHMERESSERGLSKWGLVKRESVGLSDYRLQHGIDFRDKASGGNDTPFLVPENCLLVLAKCTDMEAEVSHRMNWRNEAAPGFVAAPPPTIQDGTHQHPPRPHDAVSPHSRPDEVKREGSPVWRRAILPTPHVRTLVVRVQRSLLQ